MLLKPCNIMDSSISDGEPVAQVVEHVTFNHRVPGSSPGRLTNKSSDEQKSKTKS